MKVLLCTPYLDTPDVVSSGIGNWARIVLAYNKEKENSINIVPVSFDRHTHIEEYTVGGFKRYYSGIKEVGKCVINAICKMKSEKPDVVHICTSGHIAFLKDILLTYVAHKMGIKSIVHFRFGRVPRIIEEKGFEYKLLRKLLKMVDTAIIIDSQSFKTLTDLNYKNIVYIPNLISDNFLQEVKNQEKAVVRNHKSAVFVGHVVPTKGVAELVEGCSNVPGLTLRIVGKCSAEMKDRLCSLAEGRDHGNWMTVVGELPHDEIIGEMLQADTFVFPSYTEAFPNVILEAMACGCTIAASNVGAIPEMLDYNGELTGVCYNPQSVEEVTKAVNRLYQDDNWRTRLSEKAKEKLYNTYTIEKVWSQLTKVWLTT